MKFAADILLSLAPIILEADPREIADLSSTREIRREVYRAFLEPEQLAAVDAGELASVVRNERKVEYLQAVIRFFNEVDEQFLRYGDYDEVAAKIRGIRGVGEWSSYFIMVRGLGRMERVSTIDQELAKAAAAVYNGGSCLLSLRCSGYLTAIGYTRDCGLCIFGLPWR